MGIAAAIVILSLSVSPPPSVSAEVALVADLESDEVLFVKGSMRPRAIASITKLLAVGFLLKNGLNLTAQTTMMKSDWDHTVGGARTRLIRGERYKNLDLVRAALLGSDNRAVVALGRSVGLEHAEFVKSLNAEARRLGISSAHVDDVTGISHGNTMAPLDIITLLEVSLRVPELAEGTPLVEWETSSRERSGRPLVYRNTNILVRDPNIEVLLGKTGFNSAAGWCVAAVVRLKTGRRIAVVILGAPGKHMRFRDARRLIDWSGRIPWSPRPDGK